MPKGSDTEIQGLLELANRGDREARDRLLDHACDRLLKLTRSMLAGYPSVRRWEATDDVCVRAMMRLHRALDEVKPQSVRHFFNLAGTQIRRELLDLKKHYFGPLGLGRNHHTDSQPSDEAGGTIAGAAQPEDGEDLARWGALHEQVEKLPEELREVFNLHFYEDLPLQDVATLLGVSLSTAKRRWQEARVRLYDELGGTT
jgi:RNA polymerase sigma factor (sigma-70 family)